MWTTKYWPKQLLIRIKPLLPHLIHISQTGFLQGRNISFNTCKVLNIKEHAKDEELEVLIISLDFEKAFDRVEMMAMEGVLKFFNFGPNFISWIKL